MEPIPDKIVQRLRTCTTFPTPPAVAMHVIQLAQDPEIDLGRVATAVSTDPAIAAKVMRIANSAMYARRRQSTNLRQALIVLGLNATLTLALSFTLVGTLRRDPPKGFDFNAYWRRGLLAATWAKLIATEFNRRDAEEIFLAALLQDIGMLALDRIAPEVYAGITPFQLDHARLCQHERSCVGTDHCAVGAWLLKSWNLPAQQIRAVQHSHDILASGVEAEHREFIKCVAISGELADVWLTNRNDIGIARVAQAAQKSLSIEHHRLGQMFTIIGEQIPVAQGLFEMELFDPAHLQEITETARETLMIRNLHALSEVQNLKKKTSKLSEENSALKTESARDPLTGTHNRRSFEDAAEREFNATARSLNSPLSVVFVDLDHFKMINDTHGHQAGDSMLRDVAAVLTAGLRDSDIVARYGGDEFVLLLPGADAGQATAVAKRIMNAVHARRTDIGNGRQVGITLSMGVATCDSRSRFSSVQELLAAADAALYHSKRAGRDRFTLYETIRAA
jgi:diguanylate cyclase (GGDEF)-like protein